MNPLIVALLDRAGLVCLFVWIASLITHDHSWVDRIWSIMPVVYVWIFAGFAGLADARLDVMAALVTLWGARLTFNFARKGGYSGVEDYRWAILRSRMPRWQFEIFNFFFIVIWQNVILLLIALPACTAYQHRSTPFGGLGPRRSRWSSSRFTVGETVADQQQWNFHELEEGARKLTGATRSTVRADRAMAVQPPPELLLRAGAVVDTFFFGVVAAGSILQWTVVGAFLLPPCSSVRRYSPRASPSSDIRSTRSTRLGRLRSFRGFPAAVTRL